MPTQPKAERNPHHAVQFYGDDEEFLHNLVGDWLAAGLRENEAVIVVATPAHAEAFAEKVKTRGQNLDAACANGQATILDAAETLSLLLVGNSVEWPVFRSVIGGAIDATARRVRNGRVRAYGEMVNLLWCQGKADVAMQLEEFWNRLAEDRPMQVLCSYSMESLRAENDAKVSRICSAHGSVAYSPKLLAIERA